MNNQIRYGLAGMLIGGIAVWLLTSSVFFPNSAGMLGDSYQQLNSNALDAHFIEQMIPHHEDAITMAQLAKTKAQRNEVRQLSQNIISSQGKEIDQMKAWYKNWYGKEVPKGSQEMNQHGMMGNNTAMHMGMMGDESDMTRLEQAEDFDRAFVEEMIPHHQMAVMMATMLKNGTERPEMKKLADDIIKAQTKEIEQMRKWLKDWEK